MENQKNNKGIICLLVVIVIILSVLCVLFATGTISFKNSEVDNSQKNKVIQVEDETDKGEVIENESDKSKVIENEEYFKSYLEVFLPAKSANNFLKNISSFGNEEITDFLFWYFYHEGMNTDEIKNYESTNEYKEDGTFKYNISKTKIDEIVNKYFGKNDFELVERDGRSGIRKINENNYQVFWFATGWTSAKTTFKEMIKDVDIITMVYTTKEDYSEETGELKIYLVKNNNNWNVTSIEYKKN